MKFARMAHYEQFEMTSRRAAAFARKQANERARYPLFADEIAAQQTDIETEAAKRQRRRDHFEIEQRQFHARVWRKARALYFAQTADMRAKIQLAWAGWTGPRTALYFSSLVDMTSGEQARRVARIEAEMRPLIEAARARHAVAHTIPLVFGEACDAGA